LQLIDPIVADLIKLENGVVMYDSFFEREVVVIAPVLCILCDNVRASELISHMGQSANKYCRVCKVSNQSAIISSYGYVIILILQTNKQINPSVIGEKRYKSQARTEISIIDHQPTEAQKREKRKKFGLKEGYNPLFKLSIDPYR